jgi:hypothetical protein
LVPVPADIVFIDYNGNAAFSCDNLQTKDVFLPGCREYELLIRTIMSQPEKPLVAPMQIMLPLIHPNGDNISFTAFAESGILALSDYYYLPHISMRNAMWHLQRVRKLVTQSNCCIVNDDHTTLMSLARRFRRRYKGSQFLKFGRTIAGTSMLLPMTTQLIWLCMPYGRVCGQSTGWRRNRKYTPPPSRFLECWKTQKAFRQ